MPELAQAINSGGALDIGALGAMGFKCLISAVEDLVEFLTCAQNIRHVVDTLIEEVSGSVHVREWSVEFADEPLTESEQSGANRKRRGGDRARRRSFYATYRFQFCLRQEENRTYAILESSGPSLSYSCSAELSPLCTCPAEEMGAALANSLLFQLLDKGTGQASW
jgi:hypothetical protein